MCFFFFIHSFACIMPGRCSSAGLLQTPTAAWGNLWDCRAALRKLVSSVYLESDLNHPFGKNGKYLFQLGYTPVVSDKKKIVQKTAALSFPQWALAVWDMDTATLYMVKYDRSHWFFWFICDTIRYETSTIAIFAYGGDSGTQRNFPKNTTRWPFLKRRTFLVCTAALFCSAFLAVGCTQKTSQPVLQQIEYSNLADIC